MNDCRWCPLGDCRCRGFYEDATAPQPWPDADDWADVYVPDREAS